MQRKRILVVDDDIGVTRFLKMGLEKTGCFEVREVNRGADCLAVAWAFRPDAVLLDVLMPDVDGWNLASQIQNDAHLGNTLVVFLTSIVSEDEIVEKDDILAGHYYLAKPICLERVASFLREHLGLQPKDFLSV